MPKQQEQHIQKSRSSKENGPKRRSEWLELSTVKREIGKVGA